MKKRFIGLLLSCLVSASYLPQAHAQKNNILAYLKTNPSITTGSSDEAAVTTYKSDVSVYVQAKVMRAFLQTFSDAADVLWHYNDNHYIATFKKGGRQCRAMFSTKGTLLYSILMGTQKDLPRDVYRLLKSTYIDFSIGPVAELNATRLKSWIVNLEDKDNLIVAQVVDGQLEELHHYKTHF